MSTNLRLRLISSSTQRDAEVSIRDLIIAGWAGRDPAAVHEHIEELQKLGVRTPQTTPEFYSISASRLTLEPSIQVIGEASGGEVECVLLCTGGKLWVGVGSDHTDRAAEVHGITLSKQICEKPIAPIFWDFDDLRGHWDELELRSFIADAERSLYQKGRLATLLPAKDLFSSRMDGRSTMEGVVMFCGTIPAIGGIRPCRSFELELNDPVLDRTISHRYVCQVLPIVA